MSRKKRTTKEKGEDLFRRDLKKLDRNLEQAIKTALEEFEGRVAATIEALQEKLSNS